MAETESVRVIIEVVAGLLPGKDPDPEYTKRWYIASKEWYGSENQAALMAERTGAALGYAAMLMAMPQLLNWVRVDWIWT